jgi:hypothetical protein
MIDLPLNIKPQAFKSNATNIEIVIFDLVRCRNQILLQFVHIATTNRVRGNCNSRTFREVSNGISICISD